MAPRLKTRARTTQHLMSRRERWPQPGRRTRRDRGRSLHPDYGGRITKDSPAGNSGRQITSVQVVVGRHRMLTLLPGQWLPRGLLWGDATKHNFGMTGPEMVFGPERGDNDPWHQAGRTLLLEPVIPSEPQPKESLRSFTTNATSMCSASIANN